MTAPDVPDADPLDEVASALLDGEATAAEQARAGDADVAARVATFEAVAAQLRQPGPVDPDRRESAIAAAMAATGLGEVVPLRRRRPPRWLPAAAAVAVVALLGGAVIAVAGSDDRADEAATASSDDDAADSLEAADEAAGGSSGTAFSATTAADGAVAASPAPATEGAAAAVTDLGDVTGADDLALAVRSLLPPDGGSAQRDAAELQAAAGATPCADRFGASLVAIATARVDGTPVTIGVFADRAGGRSYVAIDQADCQREIAAGPL